MSFVEKESLVTQNIPIFVIMSWAALLFSNIICPPTNSLATGDAVEPGHILGSGRKAGSRIRALKRALDKMKTKWRFIISFIFSGLAIAPLVIVINAETEANLLYLTFTGVLLY